MNGKAKKIASYLRLFENKTLKTEITSLMFLTNSQMPIAQET